MKPHLRPRVFLVDLPVPIADKLDRRLAERGFACERPHTAGEAVYRAIEDPPDLLVVSKTDPGLSQEAVLDALAEEHCEVPVIGVDAGSAPDALASVAETAHARRERRAGEEESGIHAMPERPRILVIDDDIDMHNLLSLQLGSRGYQVSHARDGKEGLTMLERVRPHTVILDLMMPRLSGVGFLYEAERRGLRLPPILIYSAYVGADLMSHRSVSAVVRKPATTTKLIETLQQAMQDSVAVANLPH